MSTFNIPPDNLPIFRAAGVPAPTPPSNPDSDKWNPGPGPDANWDIDDTPKDSVGPSPIKDSINDIPVDTSKHQKKIKVDFSINAGVNLDSGDELILPSTFLDETQEVLKRIPNIDLTEDPATREWIRTVAEGSEFNTPDDTFVSTLEDPEADFTQKFTYNELSMNAGIPRFKPSENENLKGERAVIRLMSHLGLGTLFQVPLYHSGFWVTFKPPSESEIIELNRILMSDKIKLGRYTYGLVYSNVTSYTIRRLVDFALSHVYETTLKDVSLDQLKQHIATQDLSSLLWGFICTMYPKGFKYKRACLNDPTKCNFIIEETLNVTKLQWTNKAGLTEWQRTFMSARQPKVKELPGVVRYKEELAKTQKRKVEFNKESGNPISITIKTPNLAEYIEAGYTWISDIVNIVDKTLGADNSDEERNTLITRYGQATAMRQYSHWVECIEYESNIIDDRETIDNLLDRLSGDDIIRTDFITAVISYINTSTISVIGIPTFDCPKCKTPQEQVGMADPYKNIIPLDVVSVFFGLLTQRLERMIER